MIDTFEANPMTKQETTVLLYAYIKAKCSFSDITEMVALIAGKSQNQWRLAKFNSKQEIKNDPKKFALLSKAIIDCLSGMILVGEKEIPELINKLKEGITKVEERTGLNVRDYLDFDKKGPADIKYRKYSDAHYVGELN